MASTTTNGSKNDPGIPYPRAWRGCLGKDEEVELGFWKRVEDRDAVLVLVDQLFLGFRV